MPAAQHLKILGILDLVNAALAGLGAVVLAVTTVLLLAAGLSDDDLMAAMLPTIVVEALATVLVGVLAVLSAVTGRLVMRGQGRLLQSVLAVLGICNLPLGTLFGAYALWVCWINEETAAILSGESLMPE